MVCGQRCAPLGDPGMDGDVAGERHAGQSAMQRLVGDLRRGRLVTAREAAKQVAGLQLAGQVADQVLDARE